MELTNKCKAIFQAKMWAGYFDTVLILMEILILYKLIY